MPVCITFPSMADRARLLAASRGTRQQMRYVYQMCREVLHNPTFAPSPIQHSNIFYCVVFLLFSFLFIISNYSSAVCLSTPHPEAGNWLSQQQCLILPGCLSQCKPQLYSGHLGLELCFMLLFLCARVFQNRWVTCFQTGNARHYEEHPSLCDFFGFAVAQNL